jgi:hypothetical protein
MVALLTPNIEPLVSEVAVRGAKRKASRWQSAKT